MKIHDILIDSLRDKAGKTLTYEEIQQAVLQHYPRTNPSSILPAEHSDKRGRTCQACRQQPIFKKGSRGLYRVMEHLAGDFEPARTIWGSLPWLGFAERGHANKSIIFDAAGSPLK